MAKKQFNFETVQKQISDLEKKITRLQLQKQTLELALERELDRISSSKQNDDSEQESK